MAQNINPVALLALEQGDEGYKHKDERGRVALFAIEQVDGDRFHFPTQKDAEQFMRIHGMTPVDGKEFAKLQEEHSG